MLKLLDPEIEALSAGVIAPDSPLGKGSPVVHFVGIVFPELLEAYGLAHKRVEIAFDEAAKARAFDAEEMLGESAAADAFRLFGEFCDLFPDVLGVEYGGDEADFEDVRAGMLPELLKALQTVGLEWRAQEFADAVDGTLNRLREALSLWDADVDRE